MADDIPDEWVTALRDAAYKADIESPFGYRLNLNDFPGETRAEALARLKAGDAEAEVQNEAAFRSVLAAVYPLVAARVRADTANQIADKITQRAIAEWDRDQLHAASCLNDAAEITRRFGRFVVTTPTPDPADRDWTALNALVARQEARIARLTAENEELHRNLRIAAKTEKHLNAGLKFERARVQAVRDLAKKFQRHGFGSASDYDKGGQRCAEAVLAAIGDGDDRG